MESRLDPFRAPEPLPILNTSHFVPKNGFPVVKGLKKVLNIYGSSLSDVLACAPPEISALLDIPTCTRKTKLSRFFFRKANK